MNRVDLACRHCPEKREAVDRQLEFTGYGENDILQHTITDQVDVKVLAPSLWCCVLGRCDAENSSLESLSRRSCLHPPASLRDTAISMISITIFKGKHMYQACCTQRYE